MECHYLDFGCIFFNQIIGDFLLGVVVGAVLILILASKLRFHLPITIMSEILWIAACFSYNISEQLFMVLMVAMVGILFYEALSGRLKR